MTTLNQRPRNKHLFTVLAMVAFCLITIFGLAYITSAKASASGNQSQAGARNTNNQTDDKATSKGAGVTSTPVPDSQGFNSNGSGQPMASPTFCVLSDGDFEDGTLGVYRSEVATCVPGGCGWAASTSTPFTGNYAAFAPGVTDISDQRLVRTEPMSISGGSLSFWHSYDFEANGSNFYDGGVLEASTDGGANWADMGPNITTNGYTGTLSSCCSNPLQGQMAWVGNSGGYILSTVNLAPYSNQSLLIRLREVTDNSIASVGWHMDGLYSAVVCITFTPVPSNTPTYTNTSTPTDTSTATSTEEPTNTDTPTTEPTVCSIEFADVPSDSTFYPFVRCLACRAIINGYPCGGPSEPCNGNSDPYFRSGGPVTRGQLAKIVSQSAGFTDPPVGQTFEDVLPDSSMYAYVERLASRGVMGGYTCGVLPSEPCGPNNLPYFRPAAGATRGQLTKIVANAAGFTGTPPSMYTFTDVPVGATFHPYVEALLANRPGVVGGYPCGQAEEPCDSESRPYFRPTNGLTRGQTSKISSNTFFPNCESLAMGK